MNNAYVFVIYFVPAALILWYYTRSRRRSTQSSISVLNESIDAGMTEPASLHPVIDYAKCIGCGSCVTACPEFPEHKVLGLIDRKAHLTSPTDCIGHGLCQKACPQNAITLVFGTEKRGVDIPVVNGEFETNVPGIFIAGELGGMGLIRNAIIQGKQAVEYIYKRKRVGADLDLVIIGAGPAGFSASLQAKKSGLKTVTLEQESLGGTVFQFPRGKIVMTAPVELPLFGLVKFRETSKEKLLEFWRGIEQKANLKINYQEHVESISKQGSGFIIKTSLAEYQTSSVLLTIGRRGTPRKLGVPGEELPKVVYRLINPEQYIGQHVLIVGGGDSALEAATSIAEQPNTQVILSYRGAAFSRAKAKNRKKVDAAVNRGSLEVIFNSNVREITAETVSLDTGQDIRELQNDAVIINAGGILPTGFLKSTGIEVETKYGTA